MRARRRATPPRGRCRRPSRRTTSRSPAQAARSSGFAPAHDDGVCAAGLVVAAPNSDPVETVSLVEPDRVVVVVAHLEIDLRATASPRVVEEVGQQRGADALMTTV